MAVRQSTLNEVRFLKKNTLEQESNMIGNWLRDQIRSYGVDCIYYKLDTSDIENYTDTIDENAILKNAYGYNITPDYHLSAEMITLPIVLNDIFLLNKFGLVPDLDVEFNFDSLDFACALAAKCGQLKEYKIDESEITCEVPEINDDVYYTVNPVTNEIATSSYVSANVFPYALGLGYAEEYRCEMLSGKLSVEISEYLFDKETTIVCDPYEHSEFWIEFPSNKYTYKPFKYRIEHDDYIDTLIYLTYTVRKVKTGLKTVSCPRPNKLRNVFEMQLALKRLIRFLKNTTLDTSDMSDDVSTLNKIILQSKLLAYHLRISLDSVNTLNDIAKFIAAAYDKCAKFRYETDDYKCILSGKIHGSILYYDINELGKRMELIHPQVGDLILLEMPDEKNQDKYEITECFDRQMSNDGINPLLHRYIWKCKAKRYINSYENEAVPQTEGDDVQAERIRHSNEVRDRITDSLVKTEKLSESSDVRSDSVYGGFDSVPEVSDKEAKINNINRHYDFLYEENGMYQVLVQFASNSKIATDGFDLFFIDASGNGIKLASTKVKPLSCGRLFESGIRYLKATKSSVVFTNANGQSFTLVQDAKATKGELQTCLNSLYDSTFDNSESINHDNDNFFKFKGCRTYLWSTESNLYCKLESSEELFKLV